MSNNTTPTLPVQFNAANWFEIPTKDMDKAVRFYEKTLGVTLKRELFGDMPHAVFTAQNHDDRSVAGALVTGPHLTPGSKGTVVYLYSRDGVNAALARAQAAGATVVVPHMNIGENGFIAIIDDLEGNRVGLHALQA
ncbi:MAG: VOC family protein [Deltaproteobacteria bacterium]|nr:VOC family protein [Deltaproteobacteria bacterium]